MRLPKYRRRGSFVRVGGCLRSLRALRWCRLPAAAFLACPSSSVCLRTLRTRCWRRFDDGRFSGVSEFAGLPAGLCGCFRFACLPACRSAGAFGSVRDPFAVRGALRAFGGRGRCLRGGSIEEARGRSASANLPPPPYVSFPAIRSPRRPGLRSLRSSCGPNPKIPPPFWAARAPRRAARAVRVQRARAVSRVRAAPRGVRRLSLIHI